MEENNEGINEGNNGDNYTDITTTSHLRVKPDYFYTQEDCANFAKLYINSNGKYSNFCHSIFTAGDKQQFQEYCGKHLRVCYTEVDIPENNVFKSYDITIDTNLYNSFISSSLENTFNYMFYKFKKGIYVKIHNNELAVFLPFSNIKFKNEWGNRIKVHPSFKCINNFMRYVNDLEGKVKFNPKKVNKFTNTWFANNYLLRYEYPYNEGETSVTQLSDMFRELCKHREIPDTEFFINRRDFPLLKHNLTEPYHHIYDSHNKPLISHKYKNYLPILSFSTNNDFADIPIPTCDDWTRISSFESKYFLRQCKKYSKNFNTPWKDKFPTAVFRGSNTGAGITIDTNPRLKIAYLSTIINNNSIIPLLDAGITKWNVRPRKLYNNSYLQTLDYHKLPFDLVKPMTEKEQSKYKYIVNIDGHVCAYRLSVELNMGSVILLVESNYKLWYSDLLKPYVHYVPVKRDLSDLVEKIVWCRSHDKECEEITINAREFYNTHLLKNGILDYLQKLMIKLSIV